MYTFLLQSIPNVIQSIHPFFYSAGGALVGVAKGDAEVVYTGTAAGPAGAGPGAGAGAVV